VVIALIIVLLLVEFILPMAKKKSEKPQQPKNENVEPANSMLQIG
jgi:hypothetical protein